MPGCDPGALTGSLCLPGHMGIALSLTGTFQPDTPCSSTKTHEPWPRWASLENRGAPARWQRPPSGARSGHHTHWGHSPQAPVWRLERCPCSGTPRCKGCSVEAMWLEQGLPCGCPGSSSPENTRQPGGVG